LLTGVCAAEGHKIQKVQPKQKPVAWGMLQKDGLILDVISPEEHENCEGEYTIPLVILQKAEPAAIIEVFDKDWRLEYLSLPVGKHKLYTQQYTYTTPPAAQRPWVGLTEAEVDRCWNMTPMDTHNSRHMFAYAIESKLKEKNTT
jgi:hypothetical protein